MAAIARTPAGWGQEGRALLPGNEGQEESARPRAVPGEAQGHRDGPVSAGLVLDTEGESPGGASSRRSRFLKVRDGNPRRAEHGPAAPGGASRARSCNVLSKAAQLENRIRSRRKQLEVQDTELGLEPLDEEPSSSVSGRERGRKSPGSHRTRGSGSSEGEESTQSPGESAGFKQQLDLDSEEEKMRGLMESSLGISRGKGNQKVVGSDAQRGGKKNKTPVPPGREISPTVSSKASFHNKDSENSGFGGVTSPAPSPTSRNLSGHTVTDNTVKSSVPGRGYTRQRQESFGSDRSEIKSLDELFSKADDAEDPTSSISSEFKLNILSLDDVAPDIPSEVEELKQKGENIQVTQESNKYVKSETFLVEEEDQVAHGLNDASEGDVGKTICEDKISEHLSGVSTDFPGHQQDYFDQDERTPNSEYSEDFERSLSPAESVSRMSEGPSGQHSSSASSLTRQWHKLVPVRDIGVQTAGPPVTYCWAKANTSAVLSPPLGTTYIDPVPVASHVISRDAVEALTAYSPSVLTLHAMFKQHLMWTKQFVEKIHHLHSALVESLEQDKFHYHTLEEAKEYIKNHKPPPLTLEQALEEIQRAQEE